MADLTPGAQWAIDQIRANLPEQVYASVLLDIEQHGIARAYKRVSWGHPHADDYGRTSLDAMALAILQAALVRDAMAPLEARIADLEARNASMRSELDGLRQSARMLDARTFDSIRIRGGR